MPSDETLSAWIREWKSEYCPGANISIRYGDLGDQFGNTHSEIHGQVKTSEITVNNIFETSPLTSKIVAWHEFAHAWDYYDTAYMGHDNSWMARWFRKPMMTIPGYFLVLANAIYRFVREDIENRTKKK